MEIIFKEENGNLFGSTKSLGIGKRKPELIYGIKAKELREKAKLTIEELAKEFDIRPNLLNKIEEQNAALTDAIFKKYCDKFNVNKEYFFDLDLETLILSDNGHVIKSFQTSEECKKEFNDIMELYQNAVENKDKYIMVGFEE